MEKINSTEFIESLTKKIKAEQGKMKAVNIIIAGKSGVGKSTLINAAFREHLADTGTGLPVTKEIKLIEKTGVPLKIYDTVGLELEKKSQKSTIKTIKQLISEKRKNTDPADDIHCMWYCVSAPSDRFEAMEKEFIASIAALQVPVILVLTKVFSKQSAAQFEESIRRQAPMVKKYIQVLALGSESQAAFGVEELVEETYALIPETMQHSFANAQKVSLGLKRKKSLKIVSASVAATFGEGFVPIPIADAPLMISTQTAMLAKITTIYGVDIEERKMETAIMSTAGIAGATIAGKTAASSLLKLVPGAGTLLGGMISGGVAAAITTALGWAYIQLMEMVSTGRLDLREVDESELTAIFKKLLLKYIQDRFPGK
ncbi:MAG: 50S ribosome-binding GTPase [Enterococcaceae bacterium]|jgi:uncharacterized protein (DUF697 family)/GTP-binding protein EngB required for normal cell division|nr:50S ribosome-binding GTPase [Enterococcaceae bacterium]MCI1918672.1 50S ribosome-binding GTPase [Enterococcaceae bacterium]